MEARLTFSQPDYSDMERFQAHQAFRALDKGNLEPYDATIRVCSAVTHTKSLLLECGEDQVRRNTMRIVRVAALLSINLIFCPGYESRAR